MSARMIIPVLMGPASEEVELSVTDPMDIIARSGVSADGTAEAQVHKMCDILRAAWPDEGAPEDAAGFLAYLVGRGFMVDDIVVATTHLTETVGSMTFPSKDEVDARRKHFPKPSRRN